MTAFFVANVTVKDPEKFKEYSVKAGATFPLFGGELVLRGFQKEVLTGTVDHQAVGIVKFPDEAAINKWYASEEYQALIPLRDEASDMSITIYSMPS